MELKPQLDNGPWVLDRGGIWLENFLNECLLTGIIILLQHVIIWISLRMRF